MKKMAVGGNELVAKLHDILGRLSSVAKSVEVDVPRLVAVTKTKPAEAIRAVYDCGQKHFGENYVQELIEKANSPLLLVAAADIRWHFIGHLQTNKCNKLVMIPNLWMVETVDSIKLASALNNSWSRLTTASSRLRVMIQVNTSEEETKGGCHSDDVVNLAVHIWNLCPKLELCGLMTIGRLNHDYKFGPNPDFTSLSMLRGKVSTALDIKEKDLELSMGMSNDFEEATMAGSTNVRVGSAIFGARNK